MERKQCENSDWIELLLSKKYNSIRVFPKAIDDVTKMCFWHLTVLNDLLNRYTMNFVVY